MRNYINLGRCEFTLVRQCLPHTPLDTQLAGSTRGPCSSECVTMAARAADAVQPCTPVPAESPAVEGTDPPVQASIAVTSLETPHHRRSRSGSSESEGAPSHRRSHSGSVLPGRPAAGSISLREYSLSRDDSRANDLQAGLTASRFERIRDSVLLFLLRPCFTHLAIVHILLIVMDGALFFFLMVGAHNMCSPQFDCPTRNFWLNLSLQVGMGPSQPPLPSHPPPLPSFPQPPASSSPPRLRRPSVAFRVWLC